MRLFLATVLAAPDRLRSLGGRWDILSRKAAVRHELAIHAGPDRVVRMLDVHAVLLPTLVYTVAAGTLMVVVTVPSARCLDSAGLLLTALPIYLALSFALKR
ncbi:hypothetical protein DC522_16220 [Microvirga sp. KLBC 81]|uniref:hypothetical protein n=1 Tax=Microvirga sp. KLBC 81 TaxID=1862707 RepID=UPI000D506406|nr:hypothetical protein [Microvirga sp. KLBC 81]PVE23403.1 hypothetical protein DC522_16220 [Microvirga sp. KLBC 81]